MLRLRIVVYGMQIKGKAEGLSKSVSCIFRESFCKLKIEIFTLKQYVQYVTDNLLAPVLFFFSR